MLRPSVVAWLLVLGVSTALAAQRPQPAAGQRGLVLGDLTWLEAEQVLTRDAIVVIPLGAEAKEHGPHLRLDNDRTLAEYYRRRVLAAADVIVAPTVNYHFYPSFVEYPGSTTLRFETARDVIVDIVRSLAAYGPRKFYVLNTGVSTLRPLAASAEILRAEGILFEYTNIIEVAGEAEARVSQQLRGTHADESETSAILYMAPERVDMRKAVKDDSPRGEGGLTRNPSGRGTYSASGVWGDATLATVEKGRVIVEASVAGMLREIEALRAREVPR
ncbi:creatininase family protein [Pseudogemmatithrix spongiicola]|uniref:Creatininase family protein n=1 Tax=Pseudogemmatithrix spongiicola TaxID=3062599 RepID=A0AA49Q8T7_9BACT|nr:creatininase family protein [Gemmatimonadaceae bacterium 'strain 138']WKW16497.1 creatininase family protein [Gemmatimonadaceae bacterium 'strain 318']